MRQWRNSEIDKEEGKKEKRQDETEMNDEPRMQEAMQDESRKQEEGDG